MIGYYGPNPLYRSPWARQEDEPQHRLALLPLGAGGGQWDGGGMLSGIGAPTLQSAALNGAYPMGGSSPGQPNGQPRGAADWMQEMMGGGNGVGTIGFDPNPPGAIGKGSTLGEISRAMDPFGIGQGGTSLLAALLPGPLGGLLGYGVKDATSFLDPRLSFLSGEYPRAFDFSEEDPFGSTGAAWGQGIMALGG